MAESDEYYEDSLVLDEVALASIEATEERFGAGLSQARAARSQLHTVPPPRSSTPPPKRPKTTHGWIKSVVNRSGSRAPACARLQSESGNDDPEVFVGPDGTYVLNGGNAGHESKTYGHIPFSHPPGSLDQRYATAKQPAIEPLVSAENLSLSPSQSGGHSKGLHGEPASVANPNSTSPQTELNALRVQLSELSDAYAATEKLLREEQDAHLLKAGEVSNLRRTIDKTAREHAEAMTKLKADREATEKVKTELQAKLKEEAEWISARLDFGNAMDKIPKFKGFQNAFTDSAPVLTRSPKKVHEKQKKEEDELYFGSSVAARREKTNAATDDAGRNKKEWTQGDATSLQSQHEWVHKTVDLDGLEDVRMTIDGGTEYTNPCQENMTEVGEGLQEVLLRGRNWGEELRNIVFSHIAPRTDMLTLQVLLSTPFPEELFPDKRQVFASACQMIIETCGINNGYPRFPGDSEMSMIHNVADSFVIIGGLLSEAGSAEPLVALLELVTMLILHIPPFLSSILGPAGAKNIVGRQIDPMVPPPLLSVLENVVRDHVALPRSQNVENGKITEKLRLDLAFVVVQLIESLYWGAKDAFRHQLESIYRQSQVLEILLHTGQPPELIERTVRLLVLIATHSFSFKSPVSREEIQVLKQRQLPPNAICRVVLVEYLCHYIIHPPEKRCHFIQRLIITFVTLVRDICIDAPSILIDSIFLAPSLIICITRLSRLLWEDDIELMNSSEDVKLVVGTLYMSTKLLHDLVTVSENSANLSHQLMEVAHMSGPFNGISHLFMVTFGRLSWAEVPEWLRDDCKGIFELISELAIEVIETVIAGPECDSLWAVWHPDEVLDDEEAEAQKIQIDNI